ncbi:tetraspanin [Suillus subaureus]|uniref:Tetraspanin n=1 Tax=Suillus subaureus TaxID=48587 RepID=A0A9P7EFN6_9AGAM|nr:tetraspanin [Suillus subaureus]KAG1819500.1 tetraspanin [Suillus subaureus]
MLSKKLIGAWAFFDTCLMAAGVLSLTLSIVWRQPNLLFNLTFSGVNLTVGSVLGITLLATFVLSLLVIMQRGTLGLKILNWVLLANGIIILVIGTYIWVFTLHERNNYHAVFGQQSNETKILIQDTLKCCGYFNAADEVAFGGTTCPNQAAATALNSFCVTPITKFTDLTLNNVFSTVDGFMAIVIGLFLANMCVIKKRREFERFEKIDSKRGGHSFI